MSPKRAQARASHPQQELPSATQVHSAGGKDAAAPTEAGMYANLMQKIIQGLAAGDPSSATSDSEPDSNVERSEAGTPANAVAPQATQSHSGAQSPRECETLEGAEEDRADVEIRRRAAHGTAVEYQSGKGRIGVGAPEEAEWHVPKWAPDIAMPAAASAAEARQLPMEVATTRREGAAKLVRGGVRDVRKEGKAAVRATNATTGAAWFDMKAQPITEDVKRDWRLLRLRAAFDPKKFYKAFDSTAIPKHFEMGTMIEGRGEFYSGRLTKRERKATFTEELLADVKLRRDRKRRHERLQAERQEATKKRKKLHANNKRSAHRPKH